MLSLTVQPLLHIVLIAQTAFRCVVLTPNGKSHSLAKTLSIPRKCISAF